MRFKLIAPCRASRATPIPLGESCTAGRFDAGVPRCVAVETELLRRPLDDTSEFLRLGVEGRPASDELIEEASMSRSSSSLPSSEPSSPKLPAGRISVGGSAR